MAKTSGGVRSKVLGLAAGDKAVKLKNLNWNLKKGNRDSGIVIREKSGKYAGSISSGYSIHSWDWKPAETYTARTEKQVLSWMKKRGFVPR